MPTTQVDSKFRQVINKRTALLMVRFLIICFVLGFCLGSLLIIIAVEPASQNPNVEEQLITIVPGMSGRDVTQLLYEQQLIKRPNLFHGLLRLTKADQRLKAGEYLLSASMRPLQIIGRLNAGNIVTHKVMIPEGYQIKEIAALLAEAGFVDENRFLTLAYNATLVYGDQPPLDLPIESLEGYLFPDTYRFAKGQSEESIIKHMVDRFITVVTPVIEPYLDQTDLTLHEVVTLASIVEKEVVVDEERSIVAGVYLNRLRINMPLQADPTVRYVMTENRSRVLYRDLEIDSPYNTYMYNKLPPGPIASPGLSSILAVLEPADVDYLYFVARGDGTHQFSKTYNEHLQARKELGY